MGISGINCHIIVDNDEHILDVALKVNTSYKIAVLLAAYNGIQWIDQQVNSILCQAGVDVTIFISVDLSTDDTYSWCVQLSESESRVHLLNYGEIYGGAAKNFYRLIRDVNFDGFDYVSLADQDDIWLPHKLLRAVTLMSERSLDAFSSDVLSFWEDGRKSVLVKSYPQKRFDYLFEAGGPGCTYVLTANSFIKFQKFLAKNSSAIDFRSHDWLIYAFYRRHDLNWFIDDKPLLCYRQHANNQVGCNIGWKAYKTRMSQVIDKRFRTEVEKLINLVGCPDDFKLSRKFLIFNFRKLRRHTRDAYVLLAFNMLCWF